MRSIRGNRGLVLATVLILLGMVGCGQKSPLQSYYFGTSVDGSSQSGNVTTLFWQTVQSGNGVQIKLACSNQSLYTGTFTSGSTISLAPTGQTVISAVATVDGTNLVLKNPSNGAVIQAMKAVRTINCGPTQGANAVPGGIPKQFMYASPETPGVGDENAVQLDCSPDYVAAQVAAGNTVSSGCKDISLSYDTATLPVSVNYKQGTNVKPKSTSCDISSIVCVTSDITENKIKQLASVAALSTTGQIYPGNLLQGGLLASGSGLAPITIRPRASANFTINNLKFAPGSSYGFTLPDGWTYADLQTAIYAKLDSVGIEGQAASLSFTNKQVYSDHQLDFELKIDGSIDNVDLGAKLGLNQQSEQNHILFMLRETFYTVRFDDPETMVSVFADGVNVQDPKGQISASNPPVYISTVDYGRQIYFLVSSSLDSQLITNSVSAAYDGSPDDKAVKGDSFHLASDLKYSDVLKNSTISYAVIGGGIEEAISVLGGSSPTEGSIPQTLDATGIYNNMSKFFASVTAAKYSPSNPGSPVAFTANMLKTNANVMMAYSVDFTQKNCVKYAATPAKFQMSLSNFNNQICVYPNGRNWTDGTNCYSGSNGTTQVDLTGLWGADKTTDQTLQLVQWINASGAVPAGKIAIGNSNLPTPQFSANINFYGVAYGGAGHDLVAQWTLNQNTCDLHLGVIGTVSLTSVDTQTGAFQQCPTVSDGTCS